MNTMHHSMAALSVAPDRPEGAARRTPPPSVRTAAALTLLISMMTAAGPTLANVGCPSGSSAPDCAAPQSDSALTASFHGAPAAHNGKKLFAFEIRFSQTFDALRLGAFKKALSVTGGRVVDVKRTVRGENGGVTVRVRPNSSEALTVTLAATTAGGGSLTVPGPSTPPPSPPLVSPPPVSPPVTETSTIDTSTTETSTTETPATETSAPLTAAFHGVPDEHDGKKLFSFEIRFSEEFKGMRLSALKRALLVSGGRVIDVKRTVRGENRRVTVRVRPSSHDPVTVALPSTLDCAAADAICANDGRKLSTHASMTITSPAWGPGDGTPYTLAALKSLNLHPPRAKAVVKTVSDSAPSGLPSAAGGVVNMNAMGQWSHSGYHDGTYTNLAPDIQVLERYDGGGHFTVDFPCNNPDLNNVCRIGGSPKRVGSGANATFTWTSDSGVDAYRRWFTYPANAGANDMKVHLQIVRATNTSISTPPEVTPSSTTVPGKTELAAFFNRGHDLNYFLDHDLDFFKAEAHLQAPGSAVQPTGTANTSATWTGKVVGLESSRNLLTRGQLIGGDSRVRVRFSSGGSAFARVDLTNLFGVDIVFGGQSYPDLSFTNMRITNGSFSSEGDANVTKPVGGTMSGTFRNQKTGDSGNGSNADTVGGTFEVTGKMVGGFVANL